jgi:hypothetical protein
MAILNLEISLMLCKKGEAEAPPNETDKLNLSGILKAFTSIEDLNLDPFGQPSFQQLICPSLTTFRCHPDNVPQALNLYGRTQTWSLRSGLTTNPLCPAGYPTGYIPDSDNAPTA